MPPTSEPTSVTNTYIARANGAGLADFDRDGKLDLALAGGHTFIELPIYPTGGVSFLRGSGNGALLPAQVVRRLPIPGTMAIVNVNSDRLPDVVIGHTQGLTTLLSVSRFAFKYDFSRTLISVTDEVLNSV